MDHYHIGCRGFIDKALFVEQHGTCLGVDAPCLLVRQVIVHPAATFQFRWPASRRDLNHIANDQRLAFLKMIGPQVVWQYIRIDTDRRQLIFTVSKQRIAARRDKYADAQIVARG